MFVAFLRLASTLVGDRLVQQLLRNAGADLALDVTSDRVRERRTGPSRALRHHRGRAADRGDALPAAVRALRPIEGRPDDSLPAPRGGGEDRPSREGPPAHLLEVDKAQPAPSSSTRPAAPPPPRPQARRRGRLRDSIPRLALHLTSSEATTFLWVSTRTARPTLDACSADGKTTFTMRLPRVPKSPVV